MRFYQVLIAANISLMVLAGCNSSEQSSTQTSPTASPASTVSKDTDSQANSTGVSSLLGVVAKTKTAVNKGDFVTAKKEFDGFETAWGKVEDGIKAQSKSKYDAIERSLDAVTSSLKDSKPNQGKVTTALQSLEKDINTVSN
ncbi:DUF4363 domain-containing protein [Brunnivagina elsteri]|uniref:DUF4363 domain-containing protein n=1 Tax=Brunnivagina elsteri CCALA 953 TaxID=987040 RepID=A0A2A2TM82_9CYAN|nr:DUF4363 domain-containing protein [Calothrix elsteri]PAX59597.1 DUF4363 domain-containing protein [Calothrix elsteri CCALA 953]